MSDQNQARNTDEVLEVEHTQSSFWDRPHDLEVDLVDDFFDDEEAADEGSDLGVIVPDTGETVSPDGTGGGGAEETLPLMPPSDIVVASNAVKFDPQGIPYVEVILEWTHVDRASDYEIRITEV
jgi:hypothetical protein